MILYSRLSLFKHRELKYKQERLLSHGPENLKLGYDITKYNMSLINFICYMYLRDKFHIGLNSYILVRHLNVLPIRRFDDSNIESCYCFILFFKFKIFALH